MQINPLMEEQRHGGLSHKVTLEYTDLNDTAATTKTLQVLNSLAAGHRVSCGAYRVLTAFAGTSITVLTLDVGYDLASGTDDPDAYLDAIDLLTAASGDANGAVFATLRTGHVNNVSMDIEALVTATGANLTALTQGKVEFYLGLEKLP